MKNLITLNDISCGELFDIFNRADYFKENPFVEKFKHKTFILFFPESSIRTRVTFEKGISDLGGKSILFPSDSLEKKEAHSDVVGYLNNWADCIIVRYYDLNVIKKLSEYSNCAVINGLSNFNHPCEIIADLYSIFKMDKDFMSKRYLYIGPNKNIGYAWKEAADAFGLNVTQCSPDKYAIDGIDFENDIHKAIKNADVVITDSLSNELVDDFRDYKITGELLSSSGRDIIFNPCPPFYRGEEVSADAIDSKYFVGYKFKKSLINVQQAIIDYCLE